VLLWFRCSNFATAQRAVATGDVVNYVIAWSYEC